MKNKYNNRKVSFFTVILASLFLIVPHIHAYAARDIIFAGDDRVSTYENTPVSIPVFANDYSSNPAPLEITRHTDGNFGTVYAFSNGEVVYEPEPDFNGSDIFSYVISDGDGYTATGWVFITIDSEKPTANGERVFMIKGSGSLLIPASQLLNNDYDPNGDSLTVESAYGAEYGTAACTGQPCSSILYIPESGSVDFDIFTYEISDSSGNTDTAVVAVVIDTSATQLYAVGDNVSTQMETPVTINVLTNDTGNTLTVTDVTWGAHGQTSINIMNDAIEYMPAPYFSGTDTFTYMVEDANGNTSYAAVAVTVASPLSSSSYDFTSNPGPSTLFSTSHAKEITITNTGWYDWFIDSLSIGGDDAVDFHSWDDLCSNTILAPNESCTFSVVFTPTSEGLKYAELAVITGEENRVFHVALYGEGTSQMPFSDISHSHWAADNIHTIFNNGITSGYPDSTYRPAKTVTRAELAVYTIRGLVADGTLASEPPDNYCGTTNQFTDVPYTYWACKYIKKISELAIDNGYPDGTFKPGDAATRLQMAFFIIRALEGEPAEGCTENLFSDVSLSDWFCTYIKRLVELGIANGYPDNTFRPWNPVTRAEMSVFITRAFLAFIPRTIEFNFTVIKTGTGSGTVTANPGVLTWESNVGTAVYASGTSVTLTADASPGSTFDGWGGACSGTGTCQVAMNSQTSVTANFVANPNQYTLTVTKTGSGSGTVSTNTGLLAWSGNTGTATYTSGTVVTLSAQASEDSTFSGWGGDSDCADGIVTMNNHKNCTATFSLSNGSGIDYISIPMTYNGVYYGGSIYGETIGPKPAQKFYKVTRPSACTTNIQFQLAGNISNYVNANMLISDSDFGTPQDALADYQHMLNTYGYLNPQQVFYNNNTYWFYFYGNPASEVVDIESPNNSVYYIEIINEENELGYFNIKSYCW
jgi:hypothetical protein